MFQIKFMSQKEKKIQPKNTISSQLGYESDRQQPTEWKGMSRQQPDLQSREYHAISFHFIHHLQKIDVITIDDK